MRRRTLIQAAVGMLARPAPLLVAQWATYYLPPGIYYLASPLILACSRVVGIRG